jgi:NifB/MoaA-like Fe-S oxidoreductase
LQGKDLGDGILLPAVMLKHGDNKFLDDRTVQELSAQLKVAIIPVNGVEELIDTCVETFSLRFNNPRRDVVGASKKNN